MKQFAVFWFILLLILPYGTLGQAELDRSTQALPKLNINRGRGSRGREELDKLAPELKALYQQFVPVRGGKPRGADESGAEGFTSSQLEGSFGIKAGEIKPMVTVAVKFTSAADLEALKKTGATVIARGDGVVYAMLPVTKLASVAGLNSVATIDVFKAMHMPSPVKDAEGALISSLGRGGASRMAPSAAAQALAAHRFQRQTLTGKGVIVGVIDTGIDWRHEDFIRPDGTSRILAIWDIFDNSYQSSNGSIGSKPPVFLEDSQTFLGTIYTNEQINAAIRGNATINSFDRFGHGTAVAGTAAGNGRATGNNVPAGTYDGVAPDADLIIVKAMDCRGFSPVATLTAEWITEIAKILKRPVVINMSYGSQFGPHDGTTEGEQFIDSLTGPGKPGRVITVSAGNDGRYSLHAAGKFGPARPGQSDNFSDPIEIFVKEPAGMMGVFDKRDDWAVAFRSSNPIFQGVDGQPARILIYKSGKAIDYRTEPAMNDPEQFEAFMKAGVGASIAAGDATADMLQFQMPGGRYLLWGVGATENVVVGKFDLYSVEPAFQNKVVFGMGTEKSAMVGSPGNAKNAITVGSYDFRGTWEDQRGQRAFFNLSVGGPSAYSSPGFRRDGHVKPDISGPARYTISSLSGASLPSSGGCAESMATEAETKITRDGFHVAWEGTSASAPYVAGVIALMLEKNPTLDAEQIRQILRSTARKDGAVGAVPNALWGWGMLDPAAAIAKTTGQAKGGKRPPGRR